MERLSSVANPDASARSARRRSAALAGLGVAMLAWGIYCEERCKDAERKALSFVGAFVALMLFVVMLFAAGAVMRR